MISRWWVVPLDLVLGGRFGIMLAARDGFYAFRDGRGARREQRRFDEAQRARRAALDDARMRRALEDNLLRRYDRR